MSNWFDDPPARVALPPRVPRKWEDGAGLRWPEPPDPNKIRRAERLADARLRGRHTRAQWLGLVREFGARCVRCGARGRWLQRDHIRPLWLGESSDAIDNIQPLCKPCNCSKGAECFNWKEYRREHGWEDVT